jgi:hypothetical protein
MRQARCHLYTLPLLLLCACFTAREPLAPGGNTTWITPTEPDILMNNFSKAVIGFDIINYTRCMKTAHFNFEADPTIKANNIGLFGSWTWDQEWQYINNLVNRRANSGSNNLNFIAPRIINFSADSLEYTAPYELLLFHSDTSFAHNFFKGQISLIIVRNRNNEWEISSWTDLKNSESKCWTELKQHFFSR